MHPSLTAALAPVLRDLVNSGSLLLDIRDEQWADAPLLSAMAYEPSGSGTGIHVRDGERRADQIAEVAEQTQDIAIEARWFAGMPVTWPECPRHPDSHPLHVGVEATRAVWRCPTLDEVVAEVGTLQPRT